MQGAGGARNVFQFFVLGRRVMSGTEAFDLTLESSVCDGVMEGERRYALTRDVMRKWLPSLECRGKSGLDKVLSEVGGV